MKLSSGLKFNFEKRIFLLTEIIASTGSWRLCFPPLNLACDCFFLMIQMVVLPTRIYITTIYSFEISLINIEIDSIFCFLIYKSII